MLKKSDSVRMMGKRAINKWVLMADYLIAAISGEESGGRVWGG
jgi:hypothetical protein